MPRPVIVGVDGSPESRAAAEWAAEEASRRDIPLRLVHAWRWLPQAVPAVPVAETSRHRAEGFLLETGEALRGAHPELEITTEQVDGAPEEVLTQATDEAELLVLGSRGLGGLTGFLIGSVGLPVVGRAESPVVLVRAAGPAPPGPVPAPATAGAPQPDGGIVLGVGLDHPCDPVTAFAFEEAVRMGASLRAVHTWDYPPAYGFASEPLDPVLHQELEAEERRALAEALRPWREKFPGVPVTEHVVTGKSAQHLVHTASGARLLVVGRRRRRAAVGTRLGPVVHGVIHHASCPVAVVPHD